MTALFRRAGSGCGEDTGAYVGDGDKGKERSRQVLQRTCSHLTAQT